MMVAMQYFDTLEYVRKAKELKNPEDLAEYQVKQINSAIETAVQHMHDELANKELATKGDIQKTEFTLTLKIEREIAQLRNDAFKCIFRTGITVILTLGSGLAGLIGMLAHQFHWF
jgi:hypothetical protein